LEVTKPVFTRRSPHLGGRDLDRRNQYAASVAGLILTTQTLIAKKPDDFDPTAAPARGGGAEFLGRA
jgi:hypothetical protein